jgi:hypothetical protein
MEISEPAMALIRDRILGSEIADPVIYLVQCSAGKTTPPEVAKAILEGSPDATIRELSLRLSGDPQQASRFLEPAVYPRKQLVRLFFRTIRGIVFYAPPGLRRLMKSAVLDVAEHGLVLKDQNGEILLPKRPPTGGNAKGP